MLARGLVMLTAVLVLAAPATAATTLTKPERALFQAVNSARTTRGLPPLRVDRTLTRAARSHSHVMLVENRLDHGDFAARMRRFGATGRALGENLAWGCGSFARARSIVIGWLNSPHHRANLLRPGFTRIGLGAAVGSFAGERSATVVTANFAGA
jgi:uncharacterized protein YkwD